MFHPKIEDAEFIPSGEHLLSKVENFSQKADRYTLILATYVYIEQIESNSARESIQKRKH